MAGISEEEEGDINALPTDFAELLELPETVFAGSYDVLAGSTVAAESMRSTCEAHPNTIEYVGCLSPAKRLTD